MAVRLESDPSGAGTWASVSSAGTTELGAYMPNEHDPLHGTFTLFWRGSVDRYQLPEFVREAEQVLDPKKGDVKGTISAFGPSRETGSTDYGGMDKLLDKSSKFFGFDAYRIKLECGRDQLILWTTFKGSDRSIDEAGENIGICMSTQLFDGPARPLITHVIRQTRPDSPKLNIDALLDEISKDFLPRFGPTPAS